MNPYSEANFLDKIRCVETRSYNRSRLASETQTKWGTVVRANSVLWGMQRIGPSLFPRILLSCRQPHPNRVTSPDRFAVRVPCSLELQSPVRR